MGCFCWGKSVAGGWKQESSLSSVFSPMHCHDQIRRAPGTPSWMFGDRGYLGVWSVVLQCQDPFHFLVKGPMLQYLGVLGTEHMKLLGKQ